MEANTKRLRRERPKGTDREPSSARSASDRGTGVELAVLGDSELILPMRRENDFGKIKDRGSIDTKTTKDCVQNILEGGPEAFLRRKEIYDH